MSALPARSTCWGADLAMLPRGSSPSGPRSTGATACSQRPRRGHLRASPCLPAAPRSRPPSLVTGAALETLESLVDKGLLRRRHVDGEDPRLEMLETVRAYGRERLERASDAPEIHRRHAEHCLALVERADPALYTRDEANWLPRLDA